MPMLARECRRRRMKIVRNAGRDSAKFDLQEDNGDVVGSFATREEAEAAAGGEAPKKEEVAPEVVVDEMPNDEMGD